VITKRDDKSLRNVKTKRDKFKSLCDAKIKHDKFKSKKYPLHRLKSSNFFNFPIFVHFWTICRSL